MIETSLSSKEIVAKLIEMGFESSDVVQAVKHVGPSINDAVSYLSNNPLKNLASQSNPRTCRASTSGNTINNSASLDRFRQSSILDHFRNPKRIRTASESDLSVSVDQEPIRVAESSNGECVFKKPRVFSEPGCIVNVNREDFGFAEFSYAKCAAENVRFLSMMGGDSSSDWEIRANNLLRKHFGFSSLKRFQKEALAAWANHEDCLVLAATGSGKSLCFQIPALLTGKVVVVISPLISLMHDQCLKLSKHGVSACFLGSGQPDSSVEQKAMRGMYDVIYVCPETVLRLITSLQKLAESRGIALFAIDEVHCVSKWGHDFRPGYRQLSVLRENFSSRKLPFLKFDIPLMALTATATLRVREDVLKSLNMSENTKIVLTSFFRPNLRFSVKHSRTSSPCSYEKDFRQLIDHYALKKKTNEAKSFMTAKEFHNGFNVCSQSSLSEAVLEDENDSEDDCSDTDEDGNKFSDNNGLTDMEGKEMSVEYLENEVDVFQSVDDWDVACGEFSGQSPSEELHKHGSLETIDPSYKLEDRVDLLKKPLEEGPTIIYVPTRKETLIISDFLCSSGVKAAAYNASLKKSHLREVHKDFHDNKLEVVVATIAFGMGIDKSNVRRIIHYGWPQSLEAYYQEAGRAGRDGRLAECILYANLTRMPSLLPSKRSEDQTKQAYKMLSDCFRYGMNTSRCRAKILVQYFGEEFSDDQCLLCDVCVEGPPKTENLKEEASILMQVIAAYNGQAAFLGDSYADTLINHEQEDFIRKPNLKTFISKIMEQSGKFSEKGHLWWRGLARIMESKGYIRESDGKMNVQIKWPEATRLGLEFLQYETEETFYCHPEADMLLSLDTCEAYSGFQYCGNGWADPEIRRERLKRRRLSQLNRKYGKPAKRRKRKSKKLKPDTRTSRGRIAAKLLNLK